MAKGRHRRTDRSQSRKRVILWYVLIAAIAVIVCAAVFWRTPTLELRSDNTNYYFVGLQHEHQFALAWENTAAEQRSTRVMMVEAASDGLTVIADRDDIGSDQASAIVDNGLLRMRMASEYAPLLIYGGGQMLLSNLFADGSDISVRYRRVSVVYLWLSGRYHN